MEPPDEQRVTDADMGGHVADPYDEAGEADAAEGSPEDEDAVASRRDRHTGSLGRNLPVAIASGVVMAIIFLATIFWSPWAFLVFVFALVVIGLLELDSAFRSHGLRPATPVALGAGVVMFFGSYAGGESAQSLGLVLLVLGALAWALLDPGGHEDLGAEGTSKLLGTGRITGSLGATCFMTLWVPFLASFIGLLLARENGAWYVMAPVALAVSNDIGAFAFGSRFGRHKLSPSVSPGKSWEGFAGGVVTVLVIAALITSRVPGFDMLTALAMGAGVAFAATLGDLAESLVKRDLGVKDLGNIIPGHGGIMDRVDAIVFALPVAHLVLIVLGL
jgi:phosphatidate cytidylyltransferase